MNEIDILSAYVSKPRQMKKINGVMTPVFLKPYDKNYNYTKRFITFNNNLLKQNLTNIIVYDDKLIYNRLNGKLERKTKYFKKKGKLKSGQKPYVMFQGDALFVNPVVVNLNNQGTLYSYKNTFEKKDNFTLYVLKQIFRRYMGNRILIKATHDDIFSYETTWDIPPTGFNKWWKAEDPWKPFQVGSDDYIFDIGQNSNPDGSFIGDQLQARMRIWVINNVDASVYNQAFADDKVNHCVLRPVREYLEYRIDKVENKETSTILKYYAAMNKLVKWETKYPVGVGIPITKLHKFCGETGFGIDLYLPAPDINKRKWKEFRPPKAPTKIFKFINTRHNHLDITAQIECHTINITQEEYDKLLVAYHEGDEYYIYNKFCIITQTKIYSVESEYNDIVNEFEKVNNLKRYRLNDKNPKQELLSQFVKASCIYNGCVDFQDTFKYRTPIVNDEDDLYKLEKLYGKKLYSYSDAINAAEKWKSVAWQNRVNDRIRQIDMNKAYTRCADSPYFEGYLAKITDMRKTDKICGMGLYVIKNINFDKCKYKEYLIKLNCYFEDNIYPSPELKFIKSLGVDFEIVAGCWGTSININWGPEKDANGEYTGMYKKSGKVRNYVKWFGCGLKTTTSTGYNYNTNNLDYIKNWKYEVQQAEEKIGYKEIGTEIRYYKTGVINDEKEYNVCINIPKQNIYHHTQICSFIYSYQRIMMIEQLLKIPVENIVRVCVDGIYYNDCDFEICKNFEVDTGIRLENGAGDAYRTKDYAWDNFDNFGDPKEYSRKEVWTGPGGCGKTYDNIMDKGNCDIIYIAHSWKLASAKRDEFNCDVSVVQRLTMDDWFIDGKVKNYWEAIANKYSTLIIDEISTLSNFNKEKIEERFKHHKLIYCGDIGYYNGKVITYQCPPIYNITGDTLFQFNKDYKHYHLDINRRCECPKLLKLLGLLRKIIERDNGIRCPEWIKKNLKVMDKNKIDYNPCDMILSRTHVANEFYDDKYKDLIKYYVMEKHFNLSSSTGQVRNTDCNIYNGQIFLEKPDIPESKYKIRHGYTIDCIQGETALYKLIIDINGLRSWQHLYTAVSRAKYFNQLCFVE